MVRWLCLFVVFPFGVWAATPAELDRLHDAMGTKALIQILSEEGAIQSDELQNEMFPGRGRIGWRATVKRIYAPDTLFATFRDAFDASLEDTDIERLLIFYTSEIGQSIATVEVEARRAMMSDDIEAAAKYAYEDLKETGRERLALLEAFEEVNELIDRNVIGALNSNLQFYKGMDDAGAFELTEEQMLNEVWGQEPEIRDDTESWVFGYMTFAYETLSNQTLEAYVDLTATSEGRALNRALFAGFDAVFQSVSYDLGAATARFSVGDEL